MRGIKWSICTKYVVMGSTESEGDKQLLNNFQMPKQELNIFYFPNLQTPPGYDHYHSEKDGSASSFTTRVHHRYTTGQDFPHHTCICTVSHETHGITHTCGILIIKIIITISLQYLKTIGGGGNTMRQPAHSH